LSLEKSKNYYHENNNNHSIHNELTKWFDFGFQVHLNNELAKWKECGRFLNDEKIIHRK